MAARAVAEKGMPITLACVAFGISESCYRYQPKLQAENTQIADWLVRLTENNRNWGFGLSFLYLRNVKGYGWNHKRVYRIYRALELNLRIRPKKRMVREKPEALTVPHTLTRGLREAERVMVGEASVNVGAANKRPYGFLGFVRVLAVVLPFAWGVGHHLPLIIENRQRVFFVGQPVTAGAGIEKIVAVSTKGRRASKQELRVSVGGGKGGNGGHRKPPHGVSRRG
jgi:putative transposase